MEAAFKERLAELERQHRAKREKDGSSSFVKVKVKKWNRGLRRRKGKAEVEPIVKVNEENTPAGTAVAITLTMRRPSSESIGSIRSVHLPQSSTVGLSSSDRSTSQDASPADAARGGRGITHPTTTPYFPPAYRPASVRSVRKADSPMAAGPSTATGPSPSPDLSLDPSAIMPAASEKTQAPGYYPAPVTEDSEVALAVATRSDGKARMPATDIEEEEVHRSHTRHIATDDKTVLEQLRLGASAPPMAVEGEAPEDDGPSAPRVEVDEHGFERHADDLGTLPERSSPSRTTKAASPHPDIPAPPRPLAPPSFFIADAIGGQEPVDEFHLLPSAPPPTGEGNAPSAPPTLEGEEVVVAPSAPPLAFDHDRDDPKGGLEDGDDRHEASNVVGAVEMRPRETISLRQNEAVSGPSDIVSPVFLPRYEPSPAYKTS